jgi:DNA-binding winged helix-turn-helix (wHTH) protein
VVTREELRHHLWSADTFVDFDLSLNTAINRLRQALGDTADNPRFIETLPRRGYRFIAPVSNGRLSNAEPVTQVPEAAINEEPVAPSPPAPDTALANPASYLLRKCPSITPCVRVRQLSRS